MVKASSDVASKTLDSLGNFGDGVLNVIDAVRDGKSLWTAGREARLAQQQQVQARVQATLAEQKRHDMELWTKQQQVKLAWAQEVTSLVAASVLGGIFPAIDYWRAVQDGKMSKADYSKLILKSCGIGFGVGKLSVALPACGYAMLGIAWLSPAVNLTRQWLSSELDGLTCLREFGTHTAVLVGQAVTCAGSMAVGGRIGARIGGAGGVWGFVIGAGAGAVVGGLLGKLLISDPLNSRFQRWKHVRTRQQKVDLAFTVLGLTNECSVDQLMRRYKRLLVQTDTRVLVTKRDC